MPHILQTCAMHFTRGDKRSLPLDCIGGAAKDVCCDNRSGFIYCAQFPLHFRQNLNVDSFQLSKTSQLPFSETFCSWSGVVDAGLLVCCLFANSFCSSRKAGKAPLLTFVSSIIPRPEGAAVLLSSS